MMGRKATRNMYSRIQIELEFSASLGFIHKESVKMRGQTILKRYKSNFVNCRLVLHRDTWYSALAQGRTELHNNIVTWRIVPQWNVRHPCAMGYYDVSVAGLSQLRPYPSATCVQETKMINRDVDIFRKSISVLKQSFFYWLHLLGKCRMFFLY